MKQLIVFVLFAVVGWQAYTQYQVRRSADANAREAAPVTDTASSPNWQRDTPSSGNYRCDGRIYCSQMTSCEEATYFLRNCPGVKMDGNNDGIPCEKQWCK